VQGGEIRPLVLPLFAKKPGEAAGEQPLQVGRRLLRVGRDAVPLLQKEGSLGLLHESLPDNRGEWADLEPGLCGGEQQDSPDLPLEWSSLVGSGFSQERSGVGAADRFQGWVPRSR